MRSSHCIERAEKVRLKEGKQKENLKRPGQSNPTKASFMSTLKVLLSPSLCDLKEDRV